MKNFALLVLSLFVTACAATTPTPSFSEFVVFEPEVTPVPTASTCEHTVENQTVSMPINSGFEYYDVDSNTVITVSCVPQSDGSAMFEQSSTAIAETVVSGTCYKLYASTGEPAFGIYTDPSIEGETETNGAVYTFLSSQPSWDEVSKDTITYYLQPGSVVFVETVCE